MNKQSLNRLFRSIGLCIALTATAVSAYAESYIIVGKNAKVFDGPSSDYVTLNQKNREVAPLPGMAFKEIENNAGWSMVEYSPGLRGYISDIVKVVKSVMPKAGTYTVANKTSEKIKAEKTNDEWKATVGSKSYRGKAFGNVVVFFGADNNPAYTLVDMGQGGVAMCYDNSVTGFF